MIAKWGFNFVRLPVSYQDWNLYRDLSNDELKTVDGLTRLYAKGTHAVALQYLDQAIAWGQQYGVHVQICMYRAPGYCVIGKESLRLFADKEEDSLEPRIEFVMQWGFIAKRYADVPVSDLSFNLLNEPGDVEADKYAGALKLAIDTIRNYTPERTIVIDGLDYATKPVAQGDDLAVSQSTHAGYFPKELSNYRIGDEHYDTKPNWPLDVAGRPEDKFFPLSFNDNGYVKASNLIDFGIRPWLSVERGAMMGEWGCDGSVPHCVALRWMRDWLVAMQTYGMGWALWNFRGDWSFLDSGRRDCSYTKYEDSMGMVHAVDHEMLALLQAH